jgi:ATP adenylyltransferase
MDILWAPWRSQYIQTFKEVSEKESCFFCEALTNTTMDKELLVVFRGIHCVIILNRYPYNGGHLLIAPNRHISDISELNDDEMIEIMMLIRKSTQVIKNISNPDGFNIGANIGRGAGAGVPGHIHFHVVPRWSGDTNFMSVLSDSKVISEALANTFEVFSNEFKKLDKKYD